MIRRLARLARSRLWGWIEERRRKFVPDFSDRFFQDGLTCEFAGEGLDLTESRSREKLVSHFRSRSRPALYMSVAELDRTAARVSDEDPNYRAEILRQARERVEESFFVYNDEYPGLSNGFRWEQLRRGVGNDVLYLERPHRFGFAPLLGLASLWSPVATISLRNVVTSWVSHAASAHSCAYRSNLVVLYRVLALHWTWFFLSGGGNREQSDAQLQYEILKILHVDARFLAERAGESVPNNHLLADGFAMWYLGTQFPEFRDAVRWSEQGESLWLRELERQTYTDGTSFEQSVHYHELACELALSYLLLSRRNGLDVPDWAEPRIRDMFAFQASCNGPHGFSPLIGDTIEDPLLPLELPGSNDGEAFRLIHDALYPPLFETPHSKRQRRGRVLWMLTESDQPTHGATPRYGPEVYPEGGYFFFSEGNDDTRLLFRTGPAPDADVFAGHMHYDFLSIYLTIGPHPVIVEAGTYTYRAAARIPGTDERWRAYFMGPASHNGLVLEEPDPLGRVVGDFRNPRSSARARSRWYIHSNVLGWADGYVEGAGAYTGHHRAVVHVAGEYFLVLDRLTRAQTHAVPRLRFQLAPDWTHSCPRPGTIVLRNGAASMALGYSTKHVQPSFVEGRSEKGMGWTSDSYGRVVASPCLTFDFAPDLSTSAVVLMTGDVDSEIEVSLTSLDEGLAIRIERPDWSDLLLIDTSSAGAPRRPVTSDGVEFEGRVAWLRRQSGRSELRALEVSRFHDGKLDVAVEPGRRVDVVKIAYDQYDVSTLVGAEGLRVELRSDADEAG